METFISTKRFDGFTTVFRQWRAENTHCKYLHGYGISFKLTFEGDLDYRNWVWDFGGMKRSEIKIDGMSASDWMKYIFDHTTILAEDDPTLETFKTLDKQGVCRLRILPQVGAERFAEYIYRKLNPFIQKETDNRVKIKQVEFFEHDKNSAIYIA
ncbi:MAG: 6-carboxytetrahydropterin synthase [Bacteroidota bacterium]|nr:6-carboxytetrahydropterin synthase [Bacteroidota bacterium]